ncbi:hypothetical protein ATANTOWER_023487, partial [Ataeniobius toweri]|nr:hypothetical protein [Ataeniobius toweri]
IRVLLSPRETEGCRCSRSRSGERKPPPTEAVSRSKTILFCKTTARRAVTCVDSPVRAFVVALTKSPSR